MQEKKILVPLLPKVKKQLEAQARRNNRAMAREAAEIIKAKLSDNNNKE